MIKKFADGNMGFVSAKTPSQFAFFMDEFNGMVQSKLYQKFNYETYKKFQRNTDDVRIMGHENSSLVEVVVNGTVYPFNINDNSFGEYLFFHVLTDEETDLIMNNKYDCTLESSINDIVKELDTKGYYYDPGTEFYFTDTNSTRAISTDWQSVVEISDDFTSKIDELAKACEDLAEKVKPIFDEDNKKENKDMKFVNFEFGPVTSDKVRMSMYGMAVKNANGEFVAYDNGKIVNVDILNFDGAKFMYKVPVAIKDVAVGDVVVHMRKPMIVIEKSPNAFVAVDVYEGEAKTILPTTSPFGFNFMTKIVSLMDMCGGTSTATADAPFGNMLPFLLMNEGTDMDPMMLMLMMGGKMDMSNPMMMYFLMKDGNGKMDDLLPLMFMMGNAGGASLAPTVPAMPTTPAVN